VGASAPRGTVFELTLPGANGTSSVQKEYFEEHIRLTSQRISVHSQKTLSRLLEENGIDPNGDAISLVYDLNPAMLTASVSEGSKLVLPTILTDLQQEDNEFHPPRVPFTLIVDSKLKTQLQDDLNNLQPRDFDRLVTRQDRKRVQNYLTGIADYAHLFTGRTLPASRRMLNQVRAEVSKVVFVFSGARAEKTKLAPDDIEQVHAIFSDLENKVSALKTGNGDVLVTVRTWDGHHTKFPVSWCVMYG